MDSIQIGPYALGAGHPTFVAFEAGATHGGLQGALALTQVAADAGANAIKFQMFDPTYSLADRGVTFSFGVQNSDNPSKTDLISAPLFDLLANRTLSQPEWRVVGEMASNLGIPLVMTIGSLEELELAMAIGASSLKIASGDITYLHLIRGAASTGLPVQLDTGSATEQEILRAVSWVAESSLIPPIVHHCPRGYPATPESTFLGAIPRLRQLLGTDFIAYSDHSPGWEMDVAAVGMGAVLVEKTLTLDRSTRSVEHVFSLEPDDARRFVRIIRDVDDAMGVVPSEAPVGSSSVRRGCYTDQDIAQGMLLGEVRLAFMRPNVGIEPWEADALAHMRFKTAIPRGAPVTRDMLESV